MAVARKPSTSISTFTFTFHVSSLAVETPDHGIGVGAQSLTLVDLLESRAHSGAPVDSSWDRGGFAPLSYSWIRTREAQ